MFPHKISPILLLLSLLGALFTSCHIADSFASWEDLKDEYPPGARAKIAEKGAGVYHATPTGQRPDEVIRYGEEVVLVEAGPVFSQVLSPSGKAGYVSTMALVPLKKRTPQEIAAEEGIALDADAPDGGAGVKSAKPSLKERASRLPLIGKWLG